MITQTTISLKVDSSNLEQLDQECHVSAKKRKEDYDKRPFSYL